MLGRILLVALVLSLLLNYYFMGLFGLGNSAIQQTIVHQGDPKAKIAILPIDGVITSESAERVQQCLKQIGADSTVKAIVVTVETPGGGVTPSDQIYHQLLTFKKTHNIQIVVSMGGLATSGGYYIACAGDWVFAQPTTITGNIGVLMPRMNLSKLAEKWGVADTTLESPQHEYKHAGSWLRPESDRDTEYLQGLIDAAYQQFTGAVSTGRNARLKQPIEKIANGMAYTAQRAQALGLVDEIGYLDDALSKAKGLAGVSNPMIVKYQRRPTFFEQVFSESSSRNPPPSVSVNVNGVNVQVDARLLEELSAPRPLYLWQGR